MFCFDDGIMDTNRGLIIFRCGVYVLSTVSCLFDELYRNFFVFKNMIITLNLSLLLVINLEIYYYYYY